MIPFSPPRIDQKIIDEVTDTLRSGWITTGPRTKLFEKKLTAYGGQKATLCVSSGSAGLELMLRWFGVGPGDEVILPAYTYAATANVIIHCGATPVFVDVNKDDMNISVSCIADAITEKTKVIMPVDLGGFPCDYDEINALVKRDDIWEKFNPGSMEQEKLGRILILSDAAHSIGAVYKGRKAGALTDITVYSFHAVKNLTTAEGGAVCLNLPKVFDNEEIYRELNIKSLHGQSKDALAKFQVGNWRYDIQEAGYKYNMTDIQAAMGLVELERYDDDMLPRRKEIFDQYARGFGKHNWFQSPVYETGEKKSSYHAYFLRIRNIDEETRDKIIQNIFQKEVSVNVHYVPLPMMSFYKQMGFDIENYPVSYDNYSREISLPVYYDLIDDQVSKVIDSVISAVEKNAGS
ncbi:MAG: DegT/DnrJ/EryC1/StrS aminotransferase family protein [Bacteroidales bacterium]|nr:DegT/DnrJ/EryC1/StrS aminotransferase family protein [Bacteroidales bacterium]MCF8398146.1 DegT/DnrJ/EryC1/StrS aminotransferase family protein [Bacteroidales bacterium]